MARIELSVCNRQHEVNLDPSPLTRAANFIFRDFIGEQVSICVSLTDDMEMSELHLRHLSDPSTTDVLTFVEEEEDKIEIEIIANAALARREAQALGWAPEHELLLYVIHGMLHGAGMDDQTAADRELMFSRQREVLIELGLNPLVVRRIVDVAAGSETDSSVSPFVAAPCDD